MGKRQKQEKEKIEKIKKEEEKKKELAKIQKQDQEKMQRGDEPKELADEEDKDEQHIDNLDNDKESSIGVDLKPDDHSKTEPKPAESVIKRGVPKNTKPAPAVVAIKMADLLSAPDDEVDQDQKNTATADASLPDNIDMKIDDVKSKELLEKQKKDEKLKLEKELKQ